MIVVRVGMRAPRSAEERELGVIVIGRAAETSSGRVRPVVGIDEGAFKAVAVIEDKEGEAALSLIRMAIAALQREFWS